MIPAHVMRELRYIEIRATRKVRSPRAGTYTSRLRGPGFDFDEHQPYRPGDDVRRIDWNVTARMNAPFVRHTHAERELNMIVALDVSRSMALGGSHHSKREAMMYITASLLFSALSDQINTGFVAFSDRVLVSSPARRTRASAWPVLEECWEALSETGGTAIAPLLKHLASTVRRTSIIFIVSDFLTDEHLAAAPSTAHGARRTEHDPADKYLRVLSARHDVIAVIPEDRAERELAAGQGYLRMRDLESGGQVTVALGRRSRALYAEEARARHDALRAAFYRAGIGHVFVPTDGNPVEPLLSFLARM